MNRLLGFAGLALVVLAALFLYVSSSLWDVRSGPEMASTSVDEPLWSVPDFELVNCDERIIGKNDLDGKVWLAAFIFTRCPGPCPLITERMAQVQAVMKEEEGFRLVSFTIDPEFDQPSVLRVYAERWKADTRRWYFLTSPDPGVMQSLSEAFKVAAFREPDSQDTEVPNITHGTNLLLVGPEGRVRAVYSPEDPDVSSAVVSGVRRILGER